MLWKSLYTLHSTKPQTDLMTPGSDLWHKLSSHLTPYQRALTMGLFKIRFPLSLLVCVDVRTLSFSLSSWDHCSGEGCFISLLGHYYNYSLCCYCAERVTSDSTSVIFLSSHWQNNPGEGMQHLKLRASLLSPAVRFHLEIVSGYLDPHTTHYTADNAWSLMCLSMFMSHIHTHSELTSGGYSTQTVGLYY